MTTVSSVADSNNGRIFKVQAEIAAVPGINVVFQRETGRQQLGRITEKLGARFERGNRHPEDGQNVNQGKNHQDDISKGVVFFAASNAFYL